jgi:hypothetical protein
MKAFLGLFVGVLGLFSVAQAAEQIKQEPGASRPLHGSYYRYGGTLGDPAPPTPNDKNLSFVFEGQTAKDLFGYIGPDVKPQKACTDDPEYRERRRGHLFCVYWKKTGYRCFLGLDLRTGRSDHGGIC